MSPPSPVPAEFHPLPIDLSSVLAGGGDALLIVPPFAQFDLPNLGVHLLASCARAQGFKVQVLYAGMYLAREISETVYYALSEAVTTHWSGRRVFANLFGERVFARAAYGVPLLGRDSESHFAELRMNAGLGRRQCVVDLPLLQRLARHVEDWTERFAREIARAGFPVVGCTTVFEQTASSIALLKRVKQHAPATITLMGGANCAGQMAEGITTLTDAVDYVFSGECERAFPAFLAGRRPEGRVVTGEPCMNLDAVPTPDYTQYYEQRLECLENDPASLDMVLLSYETSRGCWWGQKHPCTFCGIATMRYRQKSPERILEELKQLLPRHPSRRVFNVDDIMPHAYFKTVLPRLQKELPGVIVYYEEKANMSLERVCTLKDSGVNIIQPGIEALSTSLLKRMDKGITARQNIALLRYARSTQLALIWALLFGFPGDGPEDYAHYLTLLPQLSHLEAPRILMPLSIFRFNQYWRHPERYGVSNLRPASVYADILPEGANAQLVAYYHDADYPSVLTEHPELMADINTRVKAWIAAWSGEREVPTLSVQRMAPDVYLLTDTRGLPGTLSLQPLSALQAAAALVSRPLSALGELAEACRWAREQQCAVELDGWHVPLATAPVELLAEFEQRYGRAPEGEAIAA